MAKSPPPSAEEIEELSNWLMQGVTRKKVARLQLFRACAGRPTDDQVTEWDDFAAHDEMLGKLAEEVLTAAQRDGRGVLQGVRVQYMILAFDSDGKKRDQFPLTVPSGSEAIGKADSKNGYAQGVEVRDMAGMGSVALGEIVKLVALMVRLVEGRDESLLEQNKYLTQLLQAERRTQSDMLRRQQHFILFEQEQVEARARTAREERRDQMLFDKLNAWGPLVINRLLGGGHGKGAPAAEIMLAGLFESFTADDVDALMNLPIADEKKTLIGELYMSFMKRKAAAAAAAAAAEGTVKNVPLNADGHSSANGGTS